MNTKSNIMNNTAFVVVRRNGYYINVVPNEDGVITAWIRNNIPISDSLTSFPKDLKRLQKRGFTFHPVTLKEIPDLKVYSKRK